MTASEPVSEEDTPTIYNLSYDEEQVPQRELTDFVVTSGNEKISICSLDDSRPASAHIVVRGLAVAGSNSLRVVSAPLIEWCIEYGHTPHLWVRSARVWYSLTKPAKEYTKTHELARRRFEVCSRIYILGTTMTKQDCTYKKFLQLLSSPYQKMKGYSEKEVLSEKEFILSQIKNLNDEALAELSFVKELREKKPTSGKKSGHGSKKSSGAPVALAAAGEYLGPWVPSGNLDTEGKARLLKRTEKVLNQIFKSKNAWPFLEPVNPNRDGCPDYLKRIKKPMDFGTIKKNYEGGLYTSAIDVANDVRLVAANCREYNGDAHDFAKWATELEQKFENLMRGGEDAELAAMRKRTSSKKRKASDMQDAAGKSNGKKSAPKLARKTSRSSSVDVLSTKEPSSKGEESSSQRLCARSSPEGCQKYQIRGSKYCSDECGMIVARKRLEELIRAGYSAEEYIKNCVTKALVQGRS